MSNGLDALKNRGRGERKNPIPPPIHSPRKTPVTVTEPTADETLPESEGSLAPVAARAVDAADERVEQQQQTESTAPQIAPPAAVEKAPEAPEQPTNVVTAEPMTKKTVFIGVGEDTFIRQVVVAGMLNAGGKVDSNQSATIRLALRRLQAELTPEQIVEEIKQGLSKTGESGRPRF